MAGYRPHKKSNGGIMKHETDTLQFVNKRGKGKRSEDKKFYEKDMYATAEVTTAYNYLKIRVTLDFA